MTIKTRFAPSPTGMLHVGGVRTALFCWLYARHHGGIFLLRVEDTDRERSTDEAVQVILDGMQWLGLAADEGPYYQTQRYARYAEVAEQLLARGNAYRCYCSKAELDQMREAQLALKQKPRYDGRCRHRDPAAPTPNVPPVIRFANPLAGEVVVDDVVHGKVVFRNEELDDLIIRRSDGNPTYNFCVVVDDWDMDVTHVIRGEDHLNNTPRQINMLKALGATPPSYAHLPMILGPDGAKLSKRHGAVSVLEFQKAGYLPEALLNYLVRLGWSHGDQEIFSLEEMIALFDLKDVNKSASAFDPGKLDWLNQQYLMKADPQRIAVSLAEQLRSLGIEQAGQDLTAIVIAQRARSKTLHDMAVNSVFFFRAPTEYESRAAHKNLTRETAPLLAGAREALTLLEPWTAAEIGRILNEQAQARSLNLGKIAQPLRVAVAGGSVSPPIDETLAILGRAAVLERIARAEAYISARP